MASWQLFTYDPWTNRIANYFDNGTFFNSPTYLDFNQATLINNLSTIFDKNLVGIALNAANWYILVGAYAEANCQTTDNPSGLWLLSELKGIRFRKKGRRGL